MKYGIKLRTSTGNSWLQFFNEVGGVASGPIKFDNHELAEIYAQNHEIQNYNIEVIHDNESSSKGPRFIND